MRIGSSLPRALALTAALTSNACAPMATHPARTDVEAFAGTLDSLRAAARIPGLAVAAVRDGEIVLSRGFGVADVETGVPVTAETPFDVASVSKPLSAVVALKLVEEGRLDLDHPMRADSEFVEFCAAARAEGGIFFEDFRCDSEPILLRHLLTMTSNGEVGQRFLYSPIAYSWASRPMRDAAGEEFSTLVDRYVFQPAEMTRSARIHRRRPLPPALARDLAQPHRVDSSGAMVRAPPPPPQGDGAAGGVVSNALDLARFDRALDEGRLISAASRERMMTPTRNRAGEALPYGIGWFVQRHEGRRLVWHSGRWENAYSALYLKLPDERLTLILLANADGIGWDNSLDEAAVERSPFARAFLNAFPTRGW